MERLFAILPVCLILGLGPGLLIVRRFRWTPLETLTASVGLSLVLVFTAVFLIFSTGAPAWLGHVVTIAAGGLTIAARHDLKTLWRHALIRRTILSLAVLAAWTLLLLVLVRQYGGGNWFGDWLEHYQRTRHFLETRPDDLLYIGRYAFPARPPLMNALAAQMTLHTSLDFGGYQLVFALLNLLLFLSCCLVSRHFTRLGRPADPAIVAVVLGANPMFFMNSTYAWTKALAAFFVLLGVSLYMVGVRRGDRVRIGGAFLALAAATITHYSAAIPLVVIGVHFLLTLARRPVMRRSLLAALAPAALIFALWLGHIISAYGIDRGLLNNPTVLGTTGDASLADHAQTRVSNLRDTFVPAKYEGYRFYPKDASTLRRGLDQIFTWYQGNALLSLGSLNGLIAAVLGFRLIRSGRAPDWPFWTSFVGALWLGGTLAHGDREPTGLAAVALQPATYLALAFIAAQVPHRSRLVRRLWVGGTMVDLTLGIALAIWFQMATGEWSRTPNWAMKTDAGVLFLGDFVEPWIPLCLGAAIVVLAARVTLRTVNGSRAYST